APAASSERNRREISGDQATSRVPASRPVQRQAQPLGWITRGGPLLEALPGIRESIMARCAARASAAPGTSAATERRNRCIAFALRAQPNRRSAGPERRRREG